MVNAPSLGARHAKVRAIPQSRFRQVLMVYQVLCCEQYADRSFAIPSGEYNYQWN